jgi:hypothetical protein
LISIEIYKKENGNKKTNLTEGFGSYLENVFFSEDGKDT